MRDITLTNGGKRRTILAVFVAVALLGAAFALFFAPAANAARSDTDWVTVGETVLARSSDGTTKFNKNSLEALYGYLTADGTYSSVAAAAQSCKTSADFRALNGGKNVSVYFGGFKWDVVYLTTAQNGGGSTNKGDVILDLWLSSDNCEEATNYTSSSDIDVVGVVYPATMYSTSYVRVATLNAGGRYSTNGSTLSGVQSQDESNRYARYTMNSVSDSLTQFIATPAQVGYQAHEWDAATSNALDSRKFYYPNDAYAEPQTGGQWCTSSYPTYSFNFLNDDNSRADGAKYGSWQNDYLWLPSVTETGVEDDVGDGIWNTDVALRSSGSAKSGSASYDRSFLRSSSAYDTMQVKNLNSKGSGDSTNLKSHNIDVVRPALHINLTQANDNSEEPKVYYTFELPDSTVIPSGRSYVTAKISVTASDIFVPVGKTLMLYVKSVNGLDDSTFYLVLNGKQFRYSLSASGSHSLGSAAAYDPTYGKPIWRVVGNDQTIDSETFTITLTLISPPQTVAGTWQDALTFTAVVT